LDLCHTKPVVRNNDGRFDGVEPWQHPDDVNKDTFENHEVESVLTVLAQQQYRHMFHGERYAPESGINFIRKNEQKGEGDTYRGGYLQRVLRHFFCSRGL
jgi:hypothetical protein